MTECLNLGCGKDFRAEYVNVDTVGECDVYADVFGPLPWQDKFFDRILANDILEHVSWRKTQTVVEEWVRVLKTGGEIEIRVPNFPEIIRQYRSGSMSIQMANNLLYGGQREPRPDLSTHYSCFDEERLRLLCDMFLLEEVQLGAQPDNTQNLVLIARRI